MGTGAKATAKATSSFDPNMLAALDLASAIIRDLDGTIRFWSDGAVRMYGWTQSDAIGRRSHDLLQTRFNQPLESIEARLLDVGAWHGELFHHRHDGQELLVASHWALQRDAAGRPYGVVEINNDIGYQQTGFAAMRRLAAIIESSHDAIISKTLDGIVTSWNSAAERMFGWQAAEIIGQPLTLVFPPDRVPEEAAILEKVRAGHLIEPYETVRRRKDGTEFPVSITVSPIIDAAGAVIGASKIAHDLTERTETQRRLREAQAELFHVQRLTELGQLVSSLVHEVNQPLAAIGNYAGAGRRLLGTGQTAGANVALQKISEQTERAHHIIQRLRNFVRKSDSEQRPESLRTLIQEAVALATMSLRHHGSTVEIRIADAAMTVRADRVQIQQVLFNLLRNAVEAMEDMPRRELKIIAGCDKEGMVEVAVADTGPGLAPAVLPDLFRPFVTTKHNGMGVGLSICRSIIESHGGRLWAEDNPGGGAVFRFTLLPGG